jgi:hypothetical protein
MTMRGYVHNGVVVPERPGELPEGAAVQIEVIPSPQPAALPEPTRRQGGQWKGQVVISADFDELPDDLAEDFGFHLP